MFRKEPGMPQQTWRCAGVRSSAPREIERLKNFYERSFGREHAEELIKPPNRALIIEFPQLRTMSAQCLQFSRHPFRNVDHVIKGEERRPDFVGEKLRDTNCRPLQCPAEHRKACLMVRVSIIRMGKI